MFCKNKDLTIILVLAVVAVSLSVSLAVTASCFTQSADTANVSTITLCSNN